MLGLKSVVTIMLVILISNISIVIISVTFAPIPRWFAILHGFISGFILVEWERQVRRHNIWPWQPIPKPPPPPTAQP